MQLKNNPFDKTIKNFISNKFKNLEKQNNNYLSVENQHMDLSRNY